jgi:hypothetical protein
MTGSRTFIIGAAIALLASAPAIEAEAQIRGAGRANIGGAHAGGRGGGMGARPSSGARPSGGARAPSAGSRPSGGSASRPGGSGGGINNNGDRGGNRNNGNREINNSGNRINTGDVNIDVDNDHGWGWDGDHHPIAAGVAFGAAAAVTSAVVGSMIYSLPPACSPYAVSYYYCGGVYYAPQYQGDTVVYVVVDQP